MGFWTFLVDKRASYPEGLENQASMNIFPPPLYIKVLLPNTTFKSILPRVL